MYIYLLLLLLCVRVSEYLAVQLLVATVPWRQRSEREKGQMSEHLPERDSETAHSKREQHIESQKGMEDRRMGRVIDDDGKGTA